MHVNRTVLKRRMYIILLQFTGESWGNNILCQGMHFEAKYRIVREEYRVAN
jgi:hypothetical protein